ncbi:MAG: cytochrome c-type biogenesis protein CcmH [Chloroflexi bacterium]|nr:cytochrome c-type biogenesis protein CcmH [Chloroflexota bacterium]
MRTLFKVSLLGILFLALLVSPGVADDGSSPVSDDQVNQIARELYCPICENIPLEVCPTQACADWRELIRELLGKGWTEKQIKDYFASQYGWSVLSVPPPIGFNWILYIFPPLIVIGGAGIVFLLIRGARHSTSAPADALAGAPETANSDLLDQVERDLEKAGRDD